MESDRHRPQTPTILEVLLACCLPKGMEEVGEDFGRYRTKHSSKTLLFCGTVVPKRFELAFFDQPINKFNIKK